MNEESTVTIRIVEQPGDGPHVWYAAQVMFNPGTDNAEEVSPEIDYADPESAAAAAACAIGNALLDLIGTADRHEILVTLDGRHS